MGGGIIYIKCFLFQIWDIQDQCCLFTAEPRTSGIGGDVAACSYSDALKSLYIAADSMTALSLKTRLSLVHPLCTCDRIQEYSSAELFRG